MVRQIKQHWLHLFTPLNNQNVLAQFVAPAILGYFACVVELTHIPARQ